MDFEVGEGVGSDQRVQTLQTSFCSEDIGRSPCETVEWILDLLSWKLAKKNPVKASEWKGWQTTAVNRGAETLP